jgi:hypothetical protein
MIEMSEGAARWIDRPIAVRMSVTAWVLAQTARAPAHLRDPTPL